MSPLADGAKPTARNDLLAVARASGIYYAAHALLLLAGLISLPITTRLLSKAEYGLLSLVFATIAALTLVAGLGLGSAATRFYHDAAGKGARHLRHLCEGLLTGTAAAAGLIALGLIALTFREVNAATRPYAECLRVGAVLILVRALSSVALQINRAQERAAVHALSQIFVRYGTLVVALGALYLGPRLAWTVLVASVLVEVAALTMLLFDLKRRGLIARPRLPPSLREGLRYGLPLVMAGSARFLLDYGDRFVIERTLGLEAVASYTVPSDLLTRLAECIAMPMQLAAVPVLYRIWAEADPATASHAASQVLSYTAALLIPVAILYSLFDEALVVTVASEKYRGGGALTPYILPGVVLSCLNFVTIVGLSIRKRTLRIAAAVIGAAVLNVGLNLLLIPSWGLPGAGIATSVAYVVLVLANLVGSRPALELRLQVAPLACAALATTITVVAVALVGGLEPQSTPALLATVTAMAISALSLQIAFDGELRSTLHQWRAKRDT